MSLLITLGEPLSINVEILLKSLCKSQTEKRFPTVVVGSWEQWRWQEKAFDGKTSWDKILDGSKFLLENFLEDLPLGLYFYDCGGTEGDPRRLSRKQRGELACKALEAIPSAHSKKLATITAPIDKKICAEAGFKFPGQTEFFSSLWGGESIMTMVGPKLRVALATNHLALKDVPRALTQETVEKKLELLVTTLQNNFHIENPRIGVCGLNPHAGDKNLFGEEEEQTIRPAVRNFCTRFPHTQISGPFSADTLFWHALKGQYDGVLAMYHDQGLAPFKSLYFEEGVNMTGGLKHLRVSPDHGPAEDLFLAGKASIKSLQECFRIASNYLVP